MLEPLDHSETIVPHPSSTHTMTNRLASLLLLGLASIPAGCAAPRAFEATTPFAGPAAGAAAATDPFLRAFGVRSMGLSGSLPIVGADPVEDPPQIDASKPTNLYTTLDNSVEYNSRKTGGDLFGYRGSLSYAIDQSNLALFELPVLHNTSTDKTGLGDIRLRYFWLPYRDYDQFFGAAGPSIDIFAPTGEIKDGLGSDRWSISPGVTTGLMLADWIQTFPILSYQYLSEPVSSGIQGREEHGITIQALTPIVLADDFFVQLTPVGSFGDLGHANRGRFVMEALAQYAFEPTLQFSVFFRTNPVDEDHTVRVGAVVYF